MGDLFMNLKRPRRFKNRPDPYHYWGLTAVLNTCSALVITHLLLDPVNVASTSRSCATNDALCQARVGRLVEDIRFHDIVSFYQFFHVNLPFCLLNTLYLYDTLFYFLSYHYNTVMSSKCKKFIYIINILCKYCLYCI